MAARASSPPTSRNTTGFVGQKLVAGPSVAVIGGMPDATVRSRSSASSTAASATLTGGTIVRCGGMRPTSSTPRARRSTLTSDATGSGTSSTTPNRRRAIAGRYRSG